MSTFPERVNGSLRLLRATHLELKATCARRGITIQDALDAAVDHWLSETPPPGISTATPKNRDGIVHMGDAQEDELLVIFRSAQAASPLLAAKLIEALQLLGSPIAKAHSLAETEIERASRELETATRAVEELTAQTTTSHGGGTEAAPGHKRLKKK